MKKFTLLAFLIAGVICLVCTPTKGGDFKTMEMCIASNGALASLCPVYWWQTKESVKSTVDKMERSGINVLIPCVSANGSIYFKSPHAIYRKGVVPDSLDFDPLELLITEAKKKKMKVIPYFPFMAAGDEAVLKKLYGGEIPHKDWFNMDMYGNLCKPLAYDPANPELREYLASLAGDLLKYEIDGLMLDYIRYWGPQWGYTAKARELFAKEYGVDPQVLAVNPDKIDKIVLYCLKPRSWEGKEWRMNIMQAMLNKMEFSYKIIEETAYGIPDIPPKSILLIASCYELDEKMIAALDSILDKGGDVIFLDGPTTAMSKHEKEFGPILGLSNKHEFFPEKDLVEVPVSKHPIAKGLGDLKIRSSGNSFPRNSVTTAKEIASFGKDYPAVLLNNYKNGNVVLFNYNVLTSEAGNYGDSAYLANCINWMSDNKKLRLYIYLPKEISEKYAWIPSVMRTFLNAAKISPHLVDNINELRSLSELDGSQIKKTALIYSSYFDPGMEAMDLFGDYARKGGSVITFLDRDVNIKDMETGREVVAKYPAFFNTLPFGKPIGFDQLKDSSGHNYSILKLQIKEPGNALLKNIPDMEAEFYGVPFAESDKSGVILRMSDSTPALFHGKLGDGDIWAFNYGMQSTGEAPSRLLSNLVNDIAESKGVGYLSDKIPKLMEAWDSFRCAQVSTMVKMVKDVMRKQRPEIPLCAAVVNSYFPEKVVFQDWKKWLRSGDLDIAYPMDYYDDVANLKRMLAWQSKGIDKSKLQPLIKLYKKMPDNKIGPVSAEEVVVQLELLKSEGFDNVGFFADCYLTEDSISALKKVSQ